ncbi:hypothetical protein AB1Y20_005071 [Prymnesium parvum]|uniref:Uncharacterized protein n=1 Tax=Prymnesium parvum TaxID=97485 RepID=A0AB34J4U3_PRYPA
MLQRLPRYGSTTLFLALCTLSLAFWAIAPHHQLMPDASRTLGAASFHARTLLDSTFAARELREVGLPLDCLRKDGHAAHCIASNAAATSSVLQECAWRNASSELRVLALAESLEMLGNSFGDPQKYVAQSCTSADGRWRAFRYGPFVTTGGFSWSEVHAHLSAEAMPTYRVEGVHAIDAYVLGNADDGGRLIGLPPIHQHHFHLFGSGQPDLDDLNVHGDSQCADEEGGVNCLARSAPEGFAFLLRDRVGFETVFNDVRPNASQPLRSWIVAAFKPVPPHRLVRQIRVCNLMFGPGHHRGGTYEVLTEEESAVWVSGTILSSVSLDSVIESYIHTHPDMVHDVLFFQGEAASVFDDVDAVALANGNIVSSRHIIAEMLSSIKKRQMRPGAATLACSYMRASTREWKRVGSELEPFQRKARCAIDASARQWVLLVMHRKRSPALRKRYLMHAGIRIYHAERNGTARLLRDPGVPAWALGRLVNYRESGVGVRADAEMGAAWLQAYQPIIDAARRTPSPCGSPNDLGELITL